MTSIADPVAALVAFLKVDATVLSLVNSRVYGAELPDSQTASMPQGAIVVRPVGGGGMSINGSYVQVSDARMDVTAYGATPYEADRIRRAVTGVLKQMRKNVQGKTMLFWARYSGGAMGRDPDTEWPMALSSWQVFFSELETP